ncbi:MAG: GntR family transcriptional regulator [Microbacteriaceae bacterium]|nr:GntR family transcriptional regulator [Microbacteriaceae bacterium]
MTSSQTSQIYERLRAAILSLDLLPGERLTERGLEIDFAASRTPVRAALMRLDAEGLVVRGPRGFAVAPIDATEIGELAELREAVETAAVRSAAVRASDSEVAALSELLEAARHTADEAGVVQAGGRFHVELAALSGNSMMTDSVRGAMTRLARTRWLEGRTPESREQAWREHREIVDAVATHDADLAATLVAAHIRGTNDRLQQFLAGQQLALRSRGLTIVRNLPPLGSP